LTLPISCFSISNATSERTQEKSHTSVNSKDVIELTPKAMIY
jgi:hypothetical protein